MRAAFLTLALLAACSFEHRVTVMQSSLDAPSDDATDAPPTPSQILPGTLATATMSYVTTGQLSYTVATGSTLMLVSLSISYAGTKAQAVRWGGDTLTSAGFIDALASDGRVEIWKLVNPAAGANQITIAVDDTNSAIVVGALSFTGTDATTPHGALATATGTAGSPTISVPSATGELAFAVVMWNGAYAKLTPSTSQTSYWNQTASDVTGAGSSRAGAATTMLSWSVANNYDEYWAIAGLSLKPSIQ